jgi:hypothetical protein
MIRTISIGSTLQVQGKSVGIAPDGRLMVQVGSVVYAGPPVPRWSDLKQAPAAQGAEPANLNAS